MADKIRKARADVEVELLKGGRGDFIVTARPDGAPPTVLWDKHRMGDEFPDEAEIVEDLAEL